jgi:hypothetical protein
VSARGGGRGRLVLFAGALVTLAGIPLTWWTIERTNAPSLTGSGLQGVAIFVFLAALAMIAVIILPFASRAGESALDRPGVYALLALIAVAAYAWRVVEISGFASLGLPQEVPGLWLSGAGLVIVLWGVGDLLTTR